MSGRASPSPGPQENYTLNILRGAAMHTRYAAANGSRSLIPEVNSGHPLETSSQGRVDECNTSTLSSRDLDALVFNSAPQNSAHHAPLNETFGTRTSQLAMADVNNLGILNAESHDDGGGTSRARRRKTKKITLPFGVSEHTRISLDPPLQIFQDQYSGPRRKKVGLGNGCHDGEDGPKRKPRGRPRVNPKDEAAADRRRNQLRMAQRAYRHRRESTISSLEKKVQDLTGVNEEMSSIFISLYDFAIGKGLVQREAEFCQKLHATTERFLALAAKISAEDGNDENQDDSSKNDETEGLSVNSRKSYLKRSHAESESVSETLVSEPPSSRGGHTLAKDDVPEIHVAYMPDDHYRDNQSKTDQFQAHPSDIKVITGPTEDNANFPFDFMDLQQDRVDFPSIEEFSQQFLPHSQPTPTQSYSYNELSLSRRIHRISVEEAFRLFTSNDPAAEERIQSVFRFSLMYRSREDIAERFHKLVRTSVKESLHDWRAPFVHIGGSGTHYPINESDETWELMPKFCTGYSMGPFTTTVSGAEGLLDDQMRCTLPGLEGYFFDANDVEGYLRGRGLDIAPAADFVEVELETLGIPDLSSLENTTGERVASKISSQTTKNPPETAALGVERASDAVDLGQVDRNYRDVNPVTGYLPFPFGVFSWDYDGSAKAGDDCRDSLLMLDQNSRNSLAETSPQARRNDNKRTVTINVNVLIDEIIKREVCVGRGPGFKPVDIDIALTEAVKASVASSITAVK